MMAQTRVGVQFAGMLSPLRGAKMEASPHGSQREVGAGTLKGSVGKITILGEGCLPA